MYKKIFAFASFILTAPGINEGIMGLFVSLISKPPFLIINFLFPFIIDDIRANDIFSKYYYIYNSPFLTIVLTVGFWFLIGFIIDLLRAKYKAKT